MNTHEPTEPAFTLTFTRDGREFEVRVSEPWNTAESPRRGASEAQFDYEIVVESAEAECELLQSFGVPVEKAEYDDGVVGWRVAEGEDGD